MTSLNQSWALKGRVVNAVLGLKEFVCDLAEQSWDLEVLKVVALSKRVLSKRAQKRRNRMFMQIQDFVSKTPRWFRCDLRGSACDFAEQRWALEAEFVCLFVSLLNV